MCFLRCKPAPVELQQSEGVWRREFCWRSASTTLIHGQKENIMIIHRRHWFYRLDGETFAHAIQFKMSVTAETVRAALRQKFGAVPIEIWGR